MHIYLWDFCWFDLRKELQLARKKLIIKEKIFQCA
jgi:hypothetical protein